MPGNHPKRKNTTFATRWKFEINNLVIFFFDISFQLLKQVTDFWQNWYEFYVTGGQIKAIIYNFLQLVMIIIIIIVIVIITSWQMRASMWEKSYKNYSQCFPRISENDESVLSSVENLNTLTNRQRLSRSAMWNSEPLVFLSAPSEAKYIRRLWLKNY